MRYFLTFIFVFSVASRAGTITTRDGRTLTGELALSQDSIAVTPKGQAKQAIALKDVAEATFAEAVGQASVYPPARRDAQFDPVRRVFVEYFADADFKDRRLARYETSIYTHWNNTKTPPDPAIPHPCYVRYTARLTFPKAQMCGFRSQCYGPARLSVDGKVVYDNWAAARPFDNSSGQIMVAANTPVTLKFETSASGHLYLVRLAIANRVMQGDMFTPLPDGAVAPVVTGGIVGDPTHFRSPAVIGFDAKAESTGGKIARVELVCENEVLASAKSAPYHLDWKNPAAGVYRVRLAATDEKGITGYSDPIAVSVADCGDEKSLPAPWGQQTLGRPGQIIAGSSKFAAGVFALTKAGGQITEGDDSSQFIYQPVDGDFVLVARLKTLAPNTDTVGPLAGVMVREGMGPTDRFGALVVSPQAVQFARRVETWGRPTSIEAGEGTKVEQPAKAFEAKWLKLLRHGNRVRTYTSVDGKAWSLAGADRIDLPERVYVGLCNMSRDAQSASTAVFENVKLTLGSPVMASTAEGVLFKNGTFLASEVMALDKNGNLSCNRQGKRVYLPNADAARFIYKPISAEIAEKMTADSTGVLLGSGDFIEGEVKEVNYHVVVSSVVFGPRTFGVREADVLAVYMKTPEAPAGAYVVTAKDGSVYQCKKLSVSDGTIHLEDPALGAVELPVKNLARLKMN